MSLKLSIVSQAPLSLVADVLVIGVSEGVSTKEGVLAELEKALGPVVSRVVKREEFTGKKDQTLDLSTNDALPAGRVLVVGLGKTAPLTDVDVRLLAAKGARFALGVKAESLAIVVPGGVANAVRAAAEGTVLGSYRFTLFHTGDRLPKVNLAQVSLVVDRAATQADLDALVVGQRVGNAICISRDLINTPPNELYPAMLVRAAVQVAQSTGLGVKVYDKEALSKAGMNLFVAVGQGSAHDPHMAHLMYTPDKPAKKKVVFVGKGLTFDSGGLCIKPAPGMEEMKGDMGGAANVIGLMAAVAATRPDVEVHGIVGAAENMPDGAAYRPADIFK
ncbi:MAG TPA: M17 family peptidase N-terminal domain-containing protein, partial [Polyangium sp.]|nr:M17 family peptidase N-terminal domain-containing protein [Polyangium sp.]